MADQLFGSILKRAKDKSEIANNLTNKTLERPTTNNHKKAMMAHFDAAKAWGDHAYFACLDPTAEKNSEFKQKHHMDAHYIHRVHYIRLNEETFINESEGQTKHSPECKMVFGRKDPNCPRCQELISGSPARKS